MILSGGEMATDSDRHASGTGDEPIIVGRIAGPYGVKGWLRVVSYTEQPDKLIDYAPWYLKQGSAWRPTRVMEAKHHTKGLLVRLPGCEDRDRAAELSGSDIGIYRSQLPPTAADEYYWDDLIGLSVVTLDGLSLGTVDHLIATGANDVLVVRGERERLIPFIQGNVIAMIDLDRRVIRVDWDPEF
jgi:16S rRNA processing protein RimM